MYHLHVSRTSAGSGTTAVSRVDYICRRGKYQKRGDKVRLVQMVNMPPWAAANTDDYWRALDQGRRRCNARLLFNLEVAIPRDLTTAQQNQLMVDYVGALAAMSAGVGNRELPALYAIHEGVRSDDHQTGRRPNPHAHVLLSTSVNDCVERPKTNWFRRANRSDPAAGGAPRSAYIGSRRWLLSVRALWAQTANAALKLAGFPQRIDHRSHRARGLVAVPTLHLGPRAAAAARAGHPGPRAKQNAGVVATNQLLKKLRRERRLQALRPDLATTEPSLYEVKLRRYALEAEQELLELLRSDPLSSDIDTVAASASMLLRAPGARTLSGGAAMPNVDAVVAKVREVLGSEWKFRRVAGRLWWMVPGQEGAVVVAPGFVATDATSDGAGAALARVAVAVGMREMVGHCGSLAAQDQADTEAVLHEHGATVVWDAPRARLAPRAANR